MAQSSPQTVQVPTPTAAQTQSASDRSHRLQVFAHAVFFVLGFGLVFTILGSAAGLLGRSLNLYLPLLQRFGAIMLIIFGLATLGVFRWLTASIKARVDLDENPAAAALVSVFVFFDTLLYTERRVSEMHKVNRRWGLFSSALLGVSFAAGWVPCIGPILASILFLANDSATALQGAILLAIYSLGLGIPFLITGAAFSTTTKALRKLNRHANIVSIVSGFFLLYVAYLLWTDKLGTLTTRFIFLNEWVFQLEETIVGSATVGGNIINASLIAAIPLALVAGLISFLSPCVLPLVPAYIGYLGGTAVAGTK
jgi:cytochrome c-type biogenesis protein